MRSNVRKRNWYNKPEGNNGFVKYIRITSEKIFNKLLKRE